MKKVRQVFLLLTALGLLTAFSCGRAGAKDVSGTILDGFSWVDSVGEYYAAEDSSSQTP